MNVHPDAVSQPMPETAGVTCAVDQIAGNPVYLTAVDAHVQCLDGGGLCVAHGLIELFHFRVRFAQHHGAGHVGIVAVKTRAEIHGEKAFFQSDIARNAVRAGGIGAGNRNGVESDALGTETAHMEFHFQSDFQFGHFRLDEGENVGEGLVRDCLCLADTGDFFFVLIQAQGNQQCGAAFLQIASGQSVAEGFVQSVGHLFLFKENRFCVVCPQAGGDFRQHAAFWGEHFKFRAVDVCVCRFDIAEIGQQIGLVQRDQDITVVIVEIGQIALSYFGRYDQCVGACLTEPFFACLKMCHCKDPSFCMFSLV